jgi:hypothetical protein
MRKAIARIAVVLVAIGSVPGEAHKPITSKYTFTEHVLPIFRERCAACHVDGGAAPMPLTAYADARPWAESIRAELVAAHMPPSQAESSVGSFRNARLLPPRDLDVVLTWATGGTPEGPPLAATPPPPPADWPLGPPDLAVPVPAAVTLGPRQTESTEEFRLDATALQDRLIRAIDLLPGTPAIVRRAIFLVVTRPATPPQGTVEPDRVIGIWSPGRDTRAADTGAGFSFPRGAELVARITYRKTWKYENTPMSDRSTVGVYFADGSPTVRRIEAIDVTATRTIEDDVEAIAVRSAMEVEDGDVRTTATLPDGSRALLVQFVAQREWPQRFWYEKRVALPRGTRIESTMPIVIDVVRPGR